MVGDELVEGMCPRCKLNVVVKRRYALSRREGKAHICSDCGVSEAMIDYIRHKQGLPKLLKKEEEAAYALTFEPPIVLWGE